MTTRVLLAIILTGCISPPPPNKPAPSPAWEREATDIIVSEWAIRLDHPELVFANRPPIHWYYGECLEPKVKKNGKVSCTLGEYVKNLISDRIDLILSEVSRIFLTHELLHWALEKAQADSDGDHDSDYWKQVFDVAEVVDARMRNEQIKRKDR